MRDVDSNTLYEANLTLFSNIGPGIYDELKKIENQDTNHEIVYTKNDQVNLRIQTEKGKFFLHSNYSPYDEAQRIDDFSRNDGIDTIIILGLGLGYHIEYFINKYPQKNKIVIEPEMNILNSCIRLKDYSDILNTKNVSLMITSNDELIANQFIHMIERGIIYNFKFISLVSYLKSYSDFWDVLQKNFKTKYFGLVSNLNTHQFYKFIWTKNIFKNLPNLFESTNLNDIKNKFKSVPGILVSSGPSLNKNMHYLKDLKDKAVIVSAGSSINALLPNGIVPHMMLGVDGGELMSEMYNKVDREDILFVYTLNLHYKCLQKYKGPKMYIFTLAELKSQYFQKNLDINMPALKSGASCANVAVDFLFHLGCDPIILMGQDLCFSNDKTHAEGYLKNKKILEEDKKKYVKETDMDGNVVYTSNSLLSMKIWFEEFYVQRNGQFEFINATASGLPIKGTTRMDMEDVIDKYCGTDLDIDNKIKSLCCSPDTKTALYTMVRIKEILDVINKECSTVKRLSKKRIKLVKEILEEVSCRKTEKRVEKMDIVNKITEEIEKSDFFKYFIMSGTFDFSFAVRHKTRVDASKETDVYKKFEVLYKGIEKQYDEILVRTVDIQKLIKNQLISIKRRIDKWKIDFN